MKDLRLVQKLVRRRKSVKARVREFDRADKTDKLEETMAKSPKAQKKLRGVARRLDRNLGAEMVMHDPMLSKRLNIATVERFDYGVSDYGIRATLASGLIADLGVRPNDVVRFLEGALKGVELKVVAVTDSTHLRLEDSELLADPGAAEATEVMTVADVSGSLDGTYFTISSALDAVDYYVWIDVDNGGNDPAPIGLTGIQVPITSDLNAAGVAQAVRAAVDAEADFLAVLVASDTVKITNAAIGVTTDAADNDTGFSISVVEQGSAADPTLSESNIVARFNLSAVKASYR